MRYTNLLYIIFTIFIIYSHIIQYIFLGFLNTWPILQIVLKLVCCSLSKKGWVLVMSYTKVKPCLLYNDTVKYGHWYTATQDQDLVPSQGSNFQNAWREGGFWPPGNWESRFYISHHTITNHTLPFVGLYVQSVISTVGKGTTHTTSDACVSAITSWDFIAKTWSK